MALLHYAAKFAIWQSCVVSVCYKFGHGSLKASISVKRDTLFPLFGTPLEKSFFEDTVLSLLRTLASRSALF